MGGFKLTYFNARGRAEVIRLLLKAGNKEFEDVRITKEEWPELKAKTPTGFLPTLETPCGKTLVQSMAICRFLAHKFGYYPEDSIYDIERAIAQVNDIFDELYRIFFSPEEKKEEMRKEFSENKGKAHLKALQKFLEEKEGGFFAGSKVTLADLCLITCMDYLKAHYSSLLEDFPKISAHYDAVLQAVPAVADWIKTRPETAM